MASVVEADSGGTVPASDGCVEWISHPIRQGETRKTLILGVVVFCSAIFVYFNTDSVGWSLVAMVFLMIGVHDYWLPTSYRMTDVGVEIRQLLLRRWRPWAMFRSYYTDRNGVLLSPFAGRSRLESFRGFYIRFAGNREAVMNKVREHLGAQSR